MMSYLIDVESHGDLGIFFFTLMWHRPFKGFLKLSEKERKKCDDKHVMKKKSVKKLFIYIC